jgi:L-fuculose-phosphate aldolase
VLTKEIREEICEFGRRVYAQGFVAANDGNISVRSGERVITTPTGVSKGYLTPDMLVEVTLDGQVVNGRLQPSSELLMHLRVYRDRQDVQAVVHAHPPYATSFAITGRPLDQPIIAEAVVTLGPVALASYATPSTPGVADSITPYLQHHDAILLQNHGALTYGPDLQTAYFRMESLEFYARLVLLSGQVGTPRLLNDGQVAELHQLRAKLLLGH